MARCWLKWSLLLLTTVVAVIGLGMLLPIVAYSILRGFGWIDRLNASAIAAHYGPVSRVLS